MKIDCQKTVVMLNALPDCQAMVETLHHVAAARGIYPAYIHDAYIHGEILSVWMVYQIPTTVCRLGFAHNVELNFRRLMNDGTAYLCEVLDNEEKKIANDR